MKRLYAFLFLLSVSFAAIQASVPFHKRLTRVQTDGKTITVSILLHGDLLLYNTVDGFTVLPNEQGDYAYAVLTPAGYEASEMVAHEPADRSWEERQYVAAHAIVATPQTIQRPLSLKKPQSFITNNQDGTGKYKTSAGGSLPSIGAPVIPVIMVEFADEKFLPTTTIEEVEKLFNEKGYADTVASKHSKGSVRDYFTEQSNGLFTPSFQVVAKVSASREHAHYGKDVGGRKDANINELIQEAITLAIGQGKSFAPFVNAEKGGVPLVVIYFAGPGQQNTSSFGRSNRIWAKYAGYYQTFGGTRFNSYFVGNEQFLHYKRGETGFQKNPDGSFVVDSTKTVRDGIGVLCHELGHALGLPDFYTTNGATHTTIDLWSVMDYGLYFANGYAPMGYCAYEKNVLGWLQWKDLGEEAGLCELYPHTQPDSLQALRIVNPNNTKEYFILENRSQGKWYPSLLGEGMLVTRVCYDAHNWSNNMVNNDPALLGFQVFPADGVQQSRSQFGKWADVSVAFAGDLYPGKQDVKRITSFPVYTGVPITDQPLFHIAQDSVSKIITFSYIDSTLVTGISAPTLAEKPAPSAPIYDLQGRRVQHTHKGLYLIGGRKVLLR